MTINGDILGQYFMDDAAITHYSTDRSDKSVIEIQAAPPFKQNFLARVWGVAIHDVNYNYFTYPATREQVMHNLSTLSSECIATP